MPKIRTPIFIILLVFSGYTCIAQDNLQVNDTIVSVNIDSLIADTLLKEFILNHRPLTSAQLNMFNKPQSSSVYGSYITPYIVENDYYKVSVPAVKPVNNLRFRIREDWIFYVFALMFLILALANSLFPSYITKLFRAIVNPGFLFSYSREQVLQSALLSGLLNFIFYFSGALFIYFIAHGKGELAELIWWQFISVVSVFLFVLYGVKFIFLNFPGWIFNQKEAFSNYISMVSLVNKIAGILMLVSSLLVAFSAPEVGAAVVSITLSGLVFLVAMRLIRGYQIFSKMAKVGILGYLLSFISIELLPTMVVIKLIRTNLISRCIDFF
jgi:hypothetical protein